MHQSGRLIQEQCVDIYYSQLYCTNSTHLLNHYKTLLLAAIQLLLAGLLLILG